LLRECRRAREQDEKGNEREAHHKGAWMLA
jgi:hypothetical protein